MITRTINTFTGGIAEDLREPSTTSLSYASGFDTYSNPHKLTPYRETVTEVSSSGTITDWGMTDVVIMRYGSTSNLYALGHASGSAKAKFFEKGTALTATANWDLCTNGEDSSGTVIPGSLVAFRGKLFAMKHDGSTTYVIDYNRATTTLSATGTLTGGYPSVPSNAYWPKPYIHPKSGSCFFGAGGQMGYYRSSWTLLPTDLIPDYQNVYITSFTEYNSWLAIATAPINGDGTSKVHLWDMVSPNINDTIDFGAGTLAIIENIDGVIVGVMSNEVPSTGTDFTFNSKIIIKGYAGGTPQDIKEITTTSSTFSLQNFKAKGNKRFFFSCKSTINGTDLNQVWVVGKNKGEWFVTPDRLVNNNTALTGDVTGLSIIGDVMWAGFDTNKFYRTNVSSANYPTATYESLINPNMTLDDRTKLKKLKFVSAAKASTTGQLVISVSVDGAAYVTVATLAASGKLVKKETKTATGIALPDGYEFKFKVESTNGAELTEVKYAYEVIEKNI